MRVSIAKRRPDHTAQQEALHVHRQAFVDRRRDPDSKKDAVLQVAVRLFLERGFWRTSLTDVAETLNVTKPALYHYFRNKEEIYLECYRRGISLVEANLTKLRACAGDGLEKVVGFIYSYAMVITGDFGRCVVRQDDRELSPKARAEVRCYKRNIDRHLRRFIEEGIRDGSIRECDVKLTAFSIAGAVNSLALWFEPDGNSTAQQIAAAFTQTLTEGFAKRRNGRLSLPGFEGETSAGGPVASGGA
jgi:AcrR family transcriptional regulator